MNRLYMAAGRKNFALMYVKGHMQKCYKGIKFLNLKIFKIIFSYTRHIKGRLYRVILNKLYLLRSSDQMFLLKSRLIAHLTFVLGYFPDYKVT